MDEDHVRQLLNVLLNVWENTLAREDALRLILNDCCPDWRHHHSKYLNDPGTEEHTKIVVAPLRKIAEAVLSGEGLSLELLEQARRDITKKAN